MAVRTEGIKKSPLLWIIIVVLVVGGIISGVLVGINSGEKINISQLATPAKPEAIPETKITTPSSGVIEITAEKLVRELLANPDKYKKGTVFQVSGVYRGEKLVSYGDHSVYFFLGPAVKTSTGTNLAVEIRVSMDREVELLRAFNTLANGEVVIQGTYCFFSAQGGASLENVSLVSVTPAK